MRTWILALGVAATTGCASSLPPPNDAFAAAQADVGRAEAGGAPAVPAARLHLQLAREDLEKSRREMGADNRRAESLSALASAEAQLAIVLARQSQAEQGAQRAASDLHDAQK
jgi:hypothetical protein